MQKEELESLLADEKEPITGNYISGYELSEYIDKLLINSCEKISDEVIGIYKKFQPMKQQAPENMKTVLFSTLRNYAIEEGSKENYASELLLYRFLLIKSKLTDDDYFNIAKAMQKLDNNANYKLFTELYEKKSDNKLIAYIELSDFYKSICDYKSAIKYYEKFLEIDKTKAIIYNITADLYAKTYPYTSIQKQIELYEQSYRIDSSSRLAMHGLAFNYEKIGNNQKAHEFYKKLLENSPTENDYYNYGGFLIHCGDLKKGHQYFTHRFNINDINLKYPIEDFKEKRWDCKSGICDKTLLIHYEQGFGDTIMYSRFVPFMKKFTKKIIFVVQNELFELIDNSKVFDEIKVIPDSEFKNVNYDYSMALLDCPYALETEIKDIPYAQGYLTISKENIAKYYEKYINDSDKFKIGLSVTGATDANYNDRNIDIHKLEFLTGIKNIEIYNLQKDCKNSISNIISLGQTFESFTDSASAIMNMDLIISTDNVILNLAGALGIKTIGLFNKETNYRWFKTKGKNVGWYNSVIPLQNEIQNDWSKTLMELNNIVYDAIKR